MTITILVTLNLITTVGLAVFGLWLRKSMKAITATLTESTETLVEIVKLLEKLITIPEGK